MDIENRIYITIICLIGMFAFVKLARKDWKKGKYRWYLSYQLLAAICLADAIVPILFWLTNKPRQYGINWELAASFVVAAIIVLICHFVWLRTPVWKIIRTPIWKSKRSLKWRTE